MPKDDGQGYLSMSQLDSVKLVIPSLIQDEQSNDQYSFNLVQFHKRPILKGILAD